MSKLLWYILWVCIVVNIAILFPIARVLGNSMYPTLKNGQVLLCSKVSVKLGIFKEGHIYVYHSPSDYDKFVIKRLIEKRGNDLYFLGDNPSESLDSRDYGYVKTENIIAKVLFYRPQIKKEV